MGRKERDRIEAQSSKQYLGDLGPHPATLNLKRSMFRPRGAGGNQGYTQQC